MIWHSIVHKQCRQVAFCVGAILPRCVDVLSNQPQGVILFNKVLYDHKSDEVKYLLYICVKYVCVVYLQAAGYQWVYR